MSGASAVASARRRRAGPSDSTSNLNNNQNLKSQQPAASNNDEQKYTPLQILQIHDSKIKNLEENFYNNLMDKVSHLVAEKLSTYNLNNLNDVLNKNIIMNKELLSIKDQLNILTSTNNSTIETMNPDVLETLEKKMETSLCDKFTNINETIKSILNNVEKLSVMTSLNEINTNKIDELVKELNDIKTIVIKSQTIGLETNSDMIKMKDEFKEISSELVCLKNSFTDDDKVDILNLNEARDLLLNSVLNSDTQDDNITKLSIHDCLVEDHECNLNNLAEINITEEELKSIKDNIRDEITEVIETNKVCEQNSEQNREQSLVEPNSDNSEHSPEYSPEHGLE